MLKALSTDRLTRGSYYVVEPEQGRFAPPKARIGAGDKRVLSKRPHGYPARVEVVDRTTHGVPRVALMRAADAAAHALERLGDGTRRPVRVVLGPEGTATNTFTDERGLEVLELDGARIAAAPSHHPVFAEVMDALEPGAGRRAAWPAAADGSLLPVKRALFFESLMNTDVEHNDQELSQGVLHMISALRGTETEVVLAQVKMAISHRFHHTDGSEPRIHGLDSLETTLRGGPIGLVCITLLEAYFDNVVQLIRTLRALGCRARIAVGGVMPTLTPEHVAAHLPDVSFVCRGAGEYFIPKLCAVLGNSTVDDPLTRAQRDALANLNGLLVVDDAGKRVMCANTAETVRVEDLGRIELNLSHLRREHLVHGIEISTSRGCTYRCSFCTIIGQKTYQARSAGSIVDVLDGYARRFEELYGGDIPQAAWRVHISDDNFACDRARAAEFFRALRSTRFRLASCQVSIGDLCQRRGKTLLAAPDAQMFEALAPDLFADSDRTIARRDHIDDYGQRSWSANLQVGVESFHDEELRRHAKGYRLAHVRAAMREMAKRELHLDAYYILSNAETTADEFVSGLQEVARLKLRYPEHFHIKYPVTPYLVSIFPSASYRRHLRKGTSDALVVREQQSVANYPEYDYPFVDRDQPFDPWVATAVSDDFFSADRYYTGNLEALTARWSVRAASLPAGEEKRRGEQLLRQLDDTPRRLVFELLREVDLESGGAKSAEERLRQTEALTVARDILGPEAGWLPAYRTAGRRGATRITLFTQGHADSGVAIDTLLRGSVDLLCSSTSNGRQLTIDVASSHDVDQVIELVNAERAYLADNEVDVWVQTTRISPAQSQRATERGATVRLVVTTDSLRQTHLQNLPALAGVVVLSPTNLRGGCELVVAAHKRGLGPLRIHLSRDATWTRNSAEELATCLRDVAEDHGVAGAIELDRLTAQTCLGVLANGNIVAMTGCADAVTPSLGNLSELGNADRYLCDAPRLRPQQSTLVLASFLEWLAAATRTTDVARERVSC